MKPEIHGELSNSAIEHVVNKVEVEMSRIIKEITLEKINQEKINHEIKYIKISQNQYTDKVVDVTCDTRTGFSQNQTMHRKIQRKRLIKWI